MVPPSTRERSTYKSAFASACIDGQESYVFVKGTTPCARGHHSIQSPSTASVAAGPLYPVALTRWSFEITTAPICARLQRERLAIESATDIHVSSQEGLVRCFRWSSNNHAVKKLAN